MQTSKGSGNANEEVASHCTNCNAQHQLHPRSNWCAWCNFKQHGRFYCSSKKHWLEACYFSKPREPVQGKACRGQVCIDCRAKAKKRRQDKEACRSCSEGSEDCQEGRATLGPSRVRRCNSCTGKGGNRREDREPQVPQVPSRPPANPSSSAGPSRHVFSPPNAHEPSSPGVQHPPIDFAITDPHATHFCCQSEVRRVWRLISALLHNPTIPAGCQRCSNRTHREFLRRQPAPMPYDDEAEDVGDLSGTVPEPFGTGFGSTGFGTDGDDLAGPSNTASGAMTTTSYDKTNAVNSGFPDSYIAEAENQGHCRVRQHVYGDEDLPRFRSMASTGGTSVEDGEGESSERRGRLGIDDNGETTEQPLGLPQSHVNAINDSVNGRGSRKDDV